MTADPRTRLIRVALLAAVLASAGLTTADAASGSACPTGSSASSVAGFGYQYCGKHWRLSDLPVKVYANTNGALPDSSAFLDAVRAATRQWDLWAAAAEGTGSRPAGDCATAKVICYAGTTSATKSPSDSTNVISWVSGIHSPLGASCASNPTLGMAYAGSSGARLTDVDIHLNGNCNGSGGNGSWFGPGDRAVWGDVSGSLGGMCPSGFESQICPKSWDLWGLIAHELGHVLGLGDLNPGTGSCFVADLADAVDYQEVMYACMYPGSTTKRQLRPGDAAGLNRALLDSRSDP